MTAERFDGRVVVSKSARKAKCTYCGDAIWWGRKLSGGARPLDVASAEAVPEGRLARPHKCLGRKRRA